MGCTVAELLARVSSRELSEWMAFEKVHGPIGQYRDDIHTAMIAQKIVQMLKDPKRGKPPELKDFIPRWDDQPTPIREE